MFLYKIFVIVTNYDFTGTAMTHIPVTENMTGGEVTEGVGVVGEVEE
jgi:hypothetical protein